MSKHIDDIRENYLKMEKELVTQLNYEVGNQALTAGTNREEIWVDFFKRIVPKKFNIARSVFIIDSANHCSDEVDIAIYDEQYTPYIFNYGVIKFIPIEAVAAVVQCKSRTLDKRSLERWSESIDKLRTSSDSIVRLATYIHIGEDNKNKGNKKNAPVQTATKPIKILCHISSDKTEKDETNGRSSFDIVIEAYQNKPEKSTDQIEQRGEKYDGNLKIKFNRNENLLQVLRQYNQADQNFSEENSELDSWKEKLKNRKVEHYSIKKEDKEYTLLSFIFQFNQMLMLINNPMFFPHKAYVDMFNGENYKKEI